MAITYSKQPLKALQRMQPKRADAIRDVVAKLAENPERTDLDVRPLVGSEGVVRLRSGDWRIIVEIDGTDLVVTRIAARGSVYNTLIDGEDDEQESADGDTGYLS